MELVLNELNRNKIKWLEITFWGFLFIAIFSLPLSESIKNISIIGAYILGMILLIMKRATLKISLVGWALFLFLFVSLLSALNSSYPQKAMYGVWDILNSLLLYIALINSVNSHKKIKVILSIVVLSIGIGSILGVTEYFIWQDRFIKLKIHSLGNTPGYLVIMIGLMGGILINMRVRNWERILLIIIILLSGIALVLANSRINWGSLILILITFSLLSGTRKVFRVVLLFLLIFAVLVGGLVAMDKKIPFDRIVTLANPLKDPNFISRIPIWNGALAMALDHPILGVGPKCFQLNWNWELDEQRQRYNIPADAGQAHNMFIHVVAEMGIMGMIALIAWLTSYAYFLFKSKKDLKNELTLSLWYGALGGWIAIIIGGMTDSFIGSEVSLLIMLTLGLLYSGYRLERLKDA